MKYLIFSIVVLYSCCSLHAQTREELSKEARNALSTGSYQSSCELYVKLLAKDEPKQTDVYNAACACSLAGDTATAVDFLYQLVGSGYDDVNQLSKDKDLIALHAHANWKVILEQLAINKEINEEDYNLPLKQELERIYISDQTLRQLHTDAMKKFAEDSDELNHYWAIIAWEDSLNLIAVLKILDEYGWVGSSTVGKKANTALWLVIQHADLSVQETYLPLMKASVKLKESSGSNLATLEDRILVGQGKKQLYGTQLYLDNASGKFLLSPLEAPELVDQRRKEVGLGPIGVYLSSRGIPWDTVQKTTH